MAEHILQTLELVKGQVRELEQQLAEKKRMANSLCEMAKIQPIYSVTEPDRDVMLPSRGDEYYGQAMSTAIRRVLEARQGANLGPATVNEIHEALRSGGYQFDAANESNERKSVRICLTKNSSIFHKLPTGKFGLSKWYPKVKVKRNGAETKDTEDVEDEGVAEMAEEFGEESQDAERESMPAK